MSTFPHNTHLQQLHMNICLSEKQPLFQPAGYESVAFMINSLTLIYWLKPWLFFVFLNFVHLRGRSCTTCGVTEPNSNQPWFGLCPQVVWWGSVMLAPHLLKESQEALCAYVYVCVRAYVCVYVCKGVCVPCSNCVGSALPTEHSAVWVMRCFSIRSDVQPPTWHECLQPSCSSLPPHYLKLAESGSHSSVALHHQQPSTLLPSLHFTGSPIFTPTITISTRSIEVCTVIAFKEGGGL